jgi:hypothetical protein
LDFFFGLLLVGLWGRAPRRAARETLSLRA